MTNRLAVMCQRERYDAIHADQLWMADVVVRCPFGGLRVLDQHNAVFRLPKQLAESHHNPTIRLWLRSEANKIEHFEKRIVREFNRVVWVTSQDRDAVLNGDRAARTHREIIPIAVDPRIRTPLRRERTFRVTFLGGLHWPPNADGVRWFASQVWPAVSVAAPNAVFTIIGRNGPDTSHIRTGPRIETTGHVPDPTPFLEETTVFVVPLQSGAGMRVKVLDAWSWALPVVSTSVGVEGIRAVHETNVLLADTAQTFAAEVLRVLNDSSLAHRLADSGRATVEGSYDWRKVYQAWNRVYP
jgi:glycosyltransferase involved in cell wall biosynthesis